MSASRLPEFQARQGRLHGHLFESPLAGFPRAVYWSLTGDFAPIEVNDSEWAASLSVEWLTFDVRRWIDLSVTHSDIVRPEIVEASLYFVDFHQDAILETLHLRHVVGRRFDGSVAVRCELETPGGTTFPRSTISWRGAVEMEGIFLVRDNLFPKPSSGREAVEALAPFLEIADFTTPELEGNRYTFQPIAPPG